MSIEAIEYILDGVLVKRTINGFEQDLKESPEMELPFIFIRETITKEEFEERFGEKNKKKKRK